VLDAHTVRGRCRRLSTMSTYRWPPEMLGSSRAAFGLAIIRRGDTTQNVVRRTHKSCALHVRKPAQQNCRKPRACLICPRIGSTIVVRAA
jgi:hypothetical protein